MIAKQMDIRSNIKKYFDMAHDGETILVPRKYGKNVVIISEAEYNALSRLKRMSAYNDLLNSAHSGKTTSHTPVYSNVKEHNREKLSVIRSLKYDWNGNGAPPFPETLINNVSMLLDNLTIQPEIFPTALCTIQLEYDNSRRDHMEIEIGTNDKAEVFIVNFDGSEMAKTIPPTPDEINELVGAFYG